MMHSLRKLKSTKLQSRDSTTFHDEVEEFGRIPE